WICRPILFAVCPLMAKIFSLCSFSVFFFSSSFKSLTMALGAAAKGGGTLGWALRPKVASPCLGKIIEKSFCCFCKERTKKNMLVSFKSCKNEAKTIAKVFGKVHTFETYHQRASSPRFLARTLLTYMTATTNYADMTETPLRSITNNWVWISMLVPTRSTMISSDEPRCRGFDQSRMQFPFNLEEQDATWEDATFIQKVTNHCEFDHNHDVDDIQIKLGSSDIWIDRCSLHDSNDRLTDITRERRHHHLPWAWTCV
ncbi:hypothetical protein ZWY2020_025222, partial [Hordeum vulgare]